MTTTPSQQPHESLGLRDAAIAIQLAYPQIWFACHREHHNRSADGISDHEASVLAHIAGSPGISPSELAQHVGVVASTISAQIKRLEELGLIEIKPGADKRSRQITLTDQGFNVVSQRSPLEHRLVCQLLDKLSQPEREQAVQGLKLLAKAAKMDTGNKPAAQSQKLQHVNKQEV